MKYILKEDNIKIYLNKIYLKNKKIEKDNTEKLIKDIIKKIEKNYEIKITGYYNVDIYIDKYYGIVIEMQKETLEYFDYFENKLDMNIKVYQDIFLYEIDPLYLNKKDYKIYFYNGKTYVKIKDKITNVKFAHLLENSKIIYGETAKKIMRWLKCVNK